MDQLISPLEKSSPSLYPIWPELIAEPDSGDKASKVGGVLSYFIFSTIVVSEWFPDLSIP